MEHKDVTVEAWQIVNIVDSIHRSEGRLTLTMMGDLARGVSNGPFEIINGGGKKDKVRAGDKIDVDLDAIAGGKVCLNKEVGCFPLRPPPRIVFSRVYRPLQDLEMLLVELIVSQYLNESFHTNAYAINVYIVPGPRAPRLIRLSREDVSSGGGRRVMCSFRRKGSGKAKATKSSKKDSERSADKSKQPRSPQKKRKRGIPEEEGDGDDFVFLDEDGGSERGLVMQGRRVEGQKFAAFEDDDENEGESDDWAHSFRSSCLSPRPKKHWKHEVSRGESSKAVLGDVEVMVLSD
jgi:ATP-dependent DNA helicase Q1